MSLIVQWVMQIIVFILIATIIELITPDNMMKKYVNLVIGLILTLIFAQPLLYFLNVDISSKLTQIESAIFQNYDDKNMSESLLENQKKDIQAEQDAYILSKVEEQLINEANPILFERYKVKISHMEFTFLNEEIDKYEDLENIIVHLRVKEQQKSKEIDPIVIELEKESNQSLNLKKKTKDIQMLLQDTWDLHDKNIHIKWEGGTS